METMVHVIYDNEKIISVQEPIETGIRRTQPGRKAIIESKEVAIQDLKSKGYDVSAIEEYEQLGQ